MVLSRLPGQVQQRTGWDRQDQFSSVIGLDCIFFFFFALDWDVLYFVILLLVRYHGVRVVQLSVYCFNLSVAKGRCLWIFSVLSLLIHILI